MTDVATVQLEQDYNVPGKWRTARTPKTCCKCGKIVRPRERYYEYLGEVPAFQTGEAWCPPCSIAWAQF